MSRSEEPINLNPRSKFRKFLCAADVRVWHFSDMAAGLDDVHFPGAKRMSHFGAVRSASDPERASMTSKYISLKRARRLPADEFEQLQ